MIDDDDRMRLCVGDIVLSLNGTKLKNCFLAQQSERALQRMIEKSAEQMVLRMGTGPVDRRDLRLHTGGRKSTWQGSQNSHFYPALTRSAHT
jgi:hypothetical protein